MILSSISDQGVSLGFLEGGLTAIAVTCALCWPRMMVLRFTRLERVLGQIARKKILSVILCGLAAVILRLAILPLFPIPLPFIHDDFSFLLAADTFASGRLTNPAPAMWTHFESFHITLYPTYMSMYFPAQGLLLAAGKVLLGHPWWALLIADGLMCSAACWALRAWLPPGWAFLGGMLLVLRIGLFSYWINTYTGAGIVAALGGALVVGALPRLLRSMRMRDAMLLGAGAVLLAMSRPYEGMLLCVPAACVLAMRIGFRGARYSVKAVVRCAAITVILLVVAGSWMAYYDHKVFGHAGTLPYTINRTTYAVAPYYVWQSKRPEPAYRHVAMREFYTRMETRNLKDLQSLRGYVPNTLYKALATLRFFAGFALLAPLAMLPWVLRDRRVRFLLVAALMLAAGMSIEIFLIPHYMAPFTVVFYALGLQCMRHLRVWHPGGKPAGVALVRVCVLMCIGMAAIRLCTRPLHLSVGEWPASNWSVVWYGPDHYGVERAKLLERLEHTSGKQLAIVRYTSDHNPLDEWVYNSADIDSSKVIWAREMDTASNDELIRYYGDRKVWLVQPDLENDILMPYPQVIQVAQARK